MVPIETLRAMLVAAERKVTRTSEARRALPPGSSRARVTSANARWARACEARDRILADINAIQEREAVPGVFPVVLLIRVAFPSPRWERYDNYQTDADAERAWNTRIKGRGITAMAWWGPAATAEKMLTDPSFDPTEEATPNT